METVRINPDGSTDNATSTTWYDANGFVSNTTQVQNGDINAPNTPFNRAFVNDAQGHALYVNQGAQADSPGTSYNPADPNAGPAVNGRIQNLASDYRGGWIGNRTTNPGHVQHQMVVAGEVLARYGDAADKSAGAGAAPAFGAVAELYLSAPGNVLHGSSADPVSHTVVGGETLQSIARTTLGDSRLWYRIAQANGLSVQPDAPLQAGVTLSIPKATLSANSASTFKPYDPSRVIGDANPALSALPVPQGGGGDCGGFGQILMIAIIIAVTVYSAGALAASGALGTSAAATAASASGIAVGTGASTLGATFAAGGAVLGGGAGIGVGIAAGAVGSALGSVAGQTFGIATGMQQDFDWRSVGLAALSGGVSGGLGGFAPLGGDASPFANLVARAAVGSALTQGVSVAIGLQRSFSWANVAASAIGAGVGYGVGTNLPGDINPFVGRTITSFAAGAATSLARGGRVSIQQVATDAFGSVLGSSLVDGLRDAGAQEDRLYNLDGATGSSMGLRLGGGAGLSYGGWRASDSWSLDNSFGNYSPVESPSFDQFETGPLVAGLGGAPSLMIKVGASAAWRGHQEAVYGALDGLNAAISMGGQTPGRLADLRNDSIESLNYRRIAMQTDPAVMQEILNRGLTVPYDPNRLNRPSDLDTLGLLGAFGDTDTVHRIAVATAQAGGAGRASAQGIAAQFAQLDGFGPSFVNRIAGDASIEAAAPGLYLNTLLGMRSHVDTTMLYVASMSGEQMAQLGRYTDTVMDRGGMTRYQDNEKLAGLFASMQTTGAGMARVGEGFSVTGMGLRNFGASLGQSIGNMNPEILANSTIGKMLSPVVGPIYAVPPGSGAMDAAAARPANTTRLGVTRTNAADWRDLRDHWDTLGYSEILSSTNRTAIATGRTPKVDADWIKVFPEDAGLHGERIPMHHIGGLPVTIPLPATRHMDAHMPGGYRYNSGGPGSAAPFYK